MDITTIISSEDEQVELDDIVSTGAARGQVEKWLLLLESSMKKCIWQVHIKVVQNCYLNIQEDPWAPGEVHHDHQGLPNKIYGSEVIASRRKLVPFCEKKLPPNFGLPNFSHYLPLLLNVYFIKKL